MKKNIWKYLSIICFIATMGLYYLRATGAESEYKFYITMIIGCAIIVIALLSSIPGIATIGSGVLTISLVHQFIYFAKDIPWLFGNSAADAMFRKNNWKAFTIESGIIATFIIALVLLLIGCIPTKLSKKLGMTSAVSLTISFAILMLYRSGNYTGWYLSSGVPLFWSNGHRALLYLVLIVGIISLCFFADSVFKENVATRAAARAKPQPADNKVDSLVRLKTLLDNGTITQEEFEEKKKNLLET